MTIMFCVFLAHARDVYGSYIWIARTCEQIKKKDGQDGHMSNSAGLKKQRMVGGWSHEQFRDVSHRFSIPLSGFWV
jgi:hypothetical protein